jgi:hypothetical protein
MARLCGIPLDTLREAGPGFEVQPVQPEELGRKAIWETKDLRGLKVNWVPWDL